MPDVLIEGSPIAGAYVMGGNPARLIWLDTLIGYHFYITAGGSNLLEYRKTTDGGLTWGAAVSVPLGVTGLLKFDLWPDWKTTGDTGTLIHIVTLDSSLDDVRYKNLNTSGDVQSSTVVIDSGGTGFASSTWAIATISLTKAIGGNLDVGWWGNTGAGDFGFKVSVDGGVSWLVRTNVQDSGVVDGIQFMPGNEADNQDIYCAYWDYSADEVSLKVYDDSLDSWSETLISASMNEFSPSFAGRQFTTDIRRSDNHLMLFAWDDGGVSVATLKGWDIASAASITALTDVITAEVNHLSVGMMIDPFTDNIYVAYLGDPADTWATNLNMRYKVSQDGGTTWSAATQLNEDAATDARVIWGNDIHAVDGGRWSPVWFLDTAIDLLTSFVNSVVIGGVSPPPPPIVPNPPIGSPTNPAPQPGLAGGSLVYIGPDLRVHELVTPHSPVGRFVIGFSGAGMPPFDYVTQRSPFQHGDTVKDFFARPRIVQMLIRENFCDRDGWWDGRETLLDDLRPNRQLTSTGVVTGTLRFVRTDGTIRDLSVFIDEGPRFEPADAGVWDEWSFQEVLRFIAHNPIFFDPAQATFTFTIVLDTELVFPITFPIEFGSGRGIVNANLTYLGSWEEFPIIVIVGPIEDVTIDNLTTGEFIALDADVVAGRTVTIDLRPGFKTVTDDLGNNLIGIVSSDSDLGTFHIAPDPEATNGVNAMRLRGRHANAATSVQIRFFTRYVGI